MQMTFRWFGKELDTVSLKQIKQIPNVVGVVPALHDLPAGEAWTLDRVQKMYDELVCRRCLHFTQTVCRRQGMGVFGDGLHIGICPL